MKIKFMVAVCVAALVSGSAFAAPKSLDDRISSLESQLKSLKAAHKNPHPEMYAHGPSVISSPSFIKLTSPSSEKLMVGLSNINKDLALLKLRQKTDNYAKKHGVALPKRPLIALSGAVEGQLVYNDNNNYTDNSKLDLNLSRAELDIFGEVSPWVSAGMLISYDDSDADADLSFSMNEEGPVITSKNLPRVKNSRLSLDRGWLTFGQLNKSPVYFTIGQLYAPFGDYGSYTISSPLTKTLGRVKDRMAILGYDKNGVTAQVYAFSGETTSDDSQIIRHSGANVGYKHSWKNVEMNLGAGVIGSLADSSGMLSNVFFSGFVADAGEGDPINFSRRVNSRVLGLAGCAKVTLYDNIKLKAEYVGASKAYAATEMMFNGEGAKPYALHFEGAYDFKTHGKPSSVFAGFNYTHQALALRVPKQNYYAGYSVELLKNTVASVEYRHDVNYGENDTSVVQGEDITEKHGTARRHANVVTLQIGVYF